MIWSLFFLITANAQNPCVPYDPNNPGSPWERYCRSGKDFVISKGTGGLPNSHKGQNQGTCQEYHFSIVT